MNKTPQLARLNTARSETEKRAWLTYLRTHPSGDPLLNDVAAILNSLWFGGRTPLTAWQRGNHNAHAHLYRQEVEAEIVKLDDVAERSRRARAVSIVAKRYGIKPDTLRDRMKIKPLRGE